MRVDGFLQNSGFVLLEGGVRMHTLISFDLSKANASYFELLS